MENGVRHEQTDEDGNTQTAKAVDNTTGKEITLDIGEETRYLGSSVTISDNAVRAYSCELSIPSGQVTQGVGFTIRAVVSLGAEEATISFSLPDGVRYVPGSLTVDSKPVTPAGTPLTVSLKAGGAVRFSAVSSDSGTKTLAANVASGGESHRETLDFTASAFDLSPQQHRPAGAACVRQGGAGKHHHHLRGNAGAGPGAGQRTGHLVGLHHPA